MNLRDMLDVVSSKLGEEDFKLEEKGVKQTCESTNRIFHKKLFFNPGLHRADVRFRKLQNKMNRQKFEKYQDLMYDSG